MSFHPNTDRNFLSSLNPLIVVFFVYFSVLIRTTLEPTLPWFFRHWEVLVPMVIYFGQRRSLAEGLTLTILCTHLYSLSSAAPIGLFIILYLVLFLIARALSYVLYAETLISVLGLILLLCMSSRLLLFPIASSFGVPSPPFFEGGFIFLILGVNALTGTLSYVMLGFIDRVTAKIPVNRIQLSELQR